MILNCRLKTFVFTLAAASLITTVVNNDACARRTEADQNSQVSMEFFPIKRGYDGAQFIVTKQGYLVSLPGLGVAPDATQLAAYKDAQNNYWYIDYKGTPIKLTPEQIQWGMAQINQQAQERATAAGQPTGQYYEQQQQPTQTVIVQQPTNQGSSVNGLATGLAAAGGAVAGAAMSGLMYNNNYHGIPYGVPVYHNGGRNYYNGNGGGRVYINNSGDKYMNQWNRQTNWNNANHDHPAHYPSNSAAHFNTNTNHTHVDHHSFSGTTAHVEHHSSLGGHSLRRSGGATRSVSRTRSRGRRR